MRGAVVVARGAAVTARRLPSARSGEAPPEGVPRSGGDGKRRDGTAASRATTTVPFMFNDEATATPGLCAVVEGETD